MHTAYDTLHYRLTLLTRPDTYALREMNQQRASNEKLKLSYAHVFS